VSEPGETKTVEALAETASPREPWLPGRMVAGRYEVRGFRGRGGAGTVYRAFDHLLRMEVALKVVHPERDPEKALTRLRREVGAARASLSPHLVRIFDLGTDADGLYLTMELLPGGSLRDRLREGALAVAEALRIAESVLHGLSALHAEGTVHRDVTPGNILFSATGDAKLADFGLARRAGQPETRITEGGGVVGTAGYLSPEQARGREADPRSDLYALGVVFFEMLAGRFPHQAASELGLRLPSLAVVPDVRKFRAEAPRWLARIVARLLEVRPADRYQSAEAVLRDLEIRRAPQQLRLRRRFFRAAVIALFLLPQVGLVVMPAPRARFSHLVHTQNGIEAIGNAGERLWALPGVDPEIAHRWALARITPGGSPSIATVLNHTLDWSPEVVSILSFLDPATGKVVKQAPLPMAASVFPFDPPRFMPSSVTAVDLDQDGVDEVLVTYTHVPEAPSYTVLYSPRLDRARVVFYARGHHHFQGAVDLDGDGLPELLFAGINNGYNWVNAVAAVRLDYPLADADWDTSPAGAPDVILGSDQERQLLWYAILPRGSFETPNCLRIDDAARRLIVRYRSGKTRALDFDGFPPEPATGSSSSSSSSSSARRQDARAEVYRHLREAERLRRVGKLGLSTAEAESAFQSAQEAREPWLGEYAQRLEAKVLVGEGKMAQADASFAAIAESADDAPEVAYDAAETFHLHGDLRRAVAWYERGVGRSSAPGAGKSKHEFVKGEVLALVEEKRFGEALDAIDRFGAAFPPWESHLWLFRDYVRWRAGQRPVAEPAAIPSNWTDLERYWQLEYDFARGGDPNELLPRLDRFLAEKPETLAEALSLKAELLARLGRARKRATRRGEPSISCTRSED
jgi:serine/threonine protein kinase/tetratricopeptide (TPR) repeat protein